MSNKQKIINIYCDESCHLVYDSSSKMMGIAGIVCPKTKLKEITHKINEIKLQHKISSKTELKWTKISNRTQQLYLDLVKLFFDTKYLKFRIVVVDKSKIKNQDDDFYGKICYLLLTNLVNMHAINSIYLDKKDTRGGNRVKILHSCLRKLKREYDYGSAKIKNVQNIQSHEVALMQILDIMLGAVIYNARGLSKMKAKMAVVELIKHQTGLTLTKKTLKTEHKFNVLFFKSDGEENETM